MSTASAAASLQGGAGLLVLARCGPAPPADTGGRHARGLELRRAFLFGLLARRKPPLGMHLRGLLTLPGQLGRFGMGLLQRRLGLLSRCCCRAWRRASITASTGR
jgi:hypothetical protein